MRLHIPTIEAASSSSPPTLAHARAHTHSLSISLSTCPLSLNPAQTWVAPSAGAAADQLHPSDTYFEELCVDAGPHGSPAENPLALKQCGPAGTPSQLFKVVGGSIVHAPSGRCINVNGKGKGHRAQPGDRIDLYACDAKNQNQLWDFNASGEIQGAVGGLCFTACSGPLPPPGPSPPPPPPPKPTTGTVVLNGSALDLRFDGVIAMSANGAARLLYEYPEPTRSQLMDLFFSPGMGTCGQNPP